MTFEAAQTYLQEKAKSLGVEIEILAERHKTLAFKARQHQIEEATISLQGGLGVRVVVAGRVGYAYTEALDEAALEWVLDEAIENARLTRDDSGSLPQGRPLGSHDLVGEGLSAPVEEKRALALTLEDGIRKDPRVDRVGGASYSEAEVEHRLVSSAGARGDYRSGTASLGVSAVMRDGESLKQGIEVVFAQDAFALDPASTSQSFLEKTGRLLGAKPLPTGTYRAYLEPRALAQLLSFFWSMWSAKAVLEGKSPLKNKLGQRIASPLLTLLDDPAHPQGLDNAPFDDEGVPAKKTTLIEAGVLRSFLHNSETARKLGHENTANGRRSYKSVVGVMPFNLVVAPGQGVAIEEGVVVTELMGVHAGANPITGDFAVQGLGLLVKDGEPTPVENFVLAGNFLDLLQNISAIGDGFWWTKMGFGIGVPLVAVEEVHFAGA